MMTVLDRDNLKEIVDTEERVVVQYSAGWCGNCRIMKPKFRKLASENDKVHFVVVDAEKFPESRQLARVDNLPTFAAFRKGEKIRQVQTNKFELLKTLVDEVADN